MNVPLLYCTVFLGSPTRSLFYDVPIPYMFLFRSHHRLQLDEHDRVAGIYVCDYLHIPKFCNEALPDEQATWAPRRRGLIETSNFGFVLSSCMGTLRPHAQQSWRDGRNCWFRFWIPCVFNGCRFTVIYIYLKNWWQCSLTLFIYFVLLSSYNYTKCDTYCHQF